jgi:transitional endoplasmic reticulum ATPase
MLLSEMDGLEERGGVLFLGAMNRIDALDEAVLRPGRIGATVEITPPDATGQAEIFEIYAADLPTTSRRDGSPTPLLLASPE